MKQPFINDGNYQIISATYNLGKKAKIYSFMAEIDFPADAKIGLVETDKHLQIPLDTVWIAERGVAPSNRLYSRMVQAANPKPAPWAPVKKKTSPKI